eukprot:3365390-Pyramimonas_sp.AAC.1
MFYCSSCCPADLLTAEGARAMGPRSGYLIFERQNHRLALQTCAGLRAGLRAAEGGPSGEVAPS